MRSPDLRTWMIVDHASADREKEHLVQDGENLVGRRGSASFDDTVEEQQNVGANNVSRPSLPPEGQNLPTKASVVLVG